MLLMNDMEVKLIWDEILLDLQARLTPNAFATWSQTFKPISLFEHTFLIEVPDTFSRDWVSERYLPLIRKILKNKLKKNHVDVKILLPEEVPEVLLHYLKQPADPVTYELNISYLNPKYTFDSFVVGNSNRFAHAASLAVAEAPAKAYNPLFIYGGVGLGKTHLMHAIGHQIMAHYQRNKVAYVTSEHFTNEIINAIQFDQTPQFRFKYRGADVLLVDDIQFLAGKERTQEEFFHTFNTLYEANKQIIISSDRPPKDIPTLEERLTSRFEWGLIADIQSPDLETRIAILRKKAQTHRLTVPDETIYHIATKIPSNIRELEGALIRVVARATLTNSEITPAMTDEILKDLFNAKPPLVTVQIIHQVVANHYNLRPEELKMRKRTREIAFPRQVAMYICRQLTQESLPKIGEYFGGRDHTTVLHAIDKIQTAMSVDPSLQNTINQLIHKIQHA